MGLVAAACSCDGDDATSTAPPAPEPEPSAAPSASAAPPSPEHEGPPRLLYLPDAAGTPAEELLPVPGAGTIARRCPAEMVDVAGRFCIDRYEAILVDARSGQRISPHYHPTRAQTRASFERWIEKRLRTGPSASREMAVPEPPTWQLDRDPIPQAAVRRGELPNGYLNREVAERACRNAGKRLCTAEEWVTACRGERRRQFPYGDEYIDGACNVHRATHPARVLHGDPSVGHLDPRLNLVEEAGDPLLRRTGATESCGSEWGGDAVYDMVGNLDEWVSEPGGMFLGGFFSRNTKNGCDASVEAHPGHYFDYSLGVRCCR